MPGPLVEKQKYYRTLSALYVLNLIFIRNDIVWFFVQGVVHKRRHGLSGGRGHIFFEVRSKSLVLKRMMFREKGWGKIVQNCVTSFMEDFFITFPWNQRSRRDTSLSDRSC